MALPVLVYCASVIFNTTMDSKPESRNQRAETRERTGNGISTKQHGRSQHMRVVLVDGDGRHECKSSWGRYSALREENLLLVENGKETKADL